MSTCPLWDSAESSDEVTFKRAGSVHLLEEIVASWHCLRILGSLTHGHRGVALPPVPRKELPLGTVAMERLVGDILGNQIHDLVGAIPHRWKDSWNVSLQLTQLWFGRCPA